MTPPKFSKPKPKPAAQTKPIRYLCIGPARTSEGIKDRSFTRANEPHYDKSVMRVLDDSAEDKASFKLWLIANNRKA
jgi:hypothetical protein